MFGEHRNYLLRTYYVLTTVANPEITSRSTHSRLSHKPTEEHRCVFAWSLLVFNKPSPQASVTADRRINLNRPGIDPAPHRLRLLESLVMQPHGHVH